MAKMKIQTCCLDRNLISFYRPIRKFHSTIKENHCVPRSCGQAIWWTSQMHCVLHHLYPQQLGVS